MFDKERYITSHANECLASLVQALIWNQLITGGRQEIGVKLNYIQVFELSVETNNEVSMQVIQHSQKPPQKSETMYIECEDFESVNDKG